MTLAATEPQGRLSNYFLNVGDTGDSEVNREMPRGWVTESQRSERTEGKEM